MQNKEVDDGFENTRSFYKDLINLINLYDNKGTILMDQVLIDGLIFWRTGNRSKSWEKSQKTELNQ